MSSEERPRNKKHYVFKGSNFILSPLNTKNISMNFINANKNKNKNSSNILLNNLNTKKSKKNLNQEFVKSNPNLLAFSKANNSFINAIKINNNLKKNFVDITNNNINFIKKLYVNKKNKEINNFMNNSKSHNKSNSNEKKISYDYLKTEILTSDSNILNKEKKLKKIPSINILFQQKSNFQRSNSHYYDDLFGSSSGLFKMDLPNYKFDSERNFYDHINNAQKAKDDQLRTESGTNQSTNESKIAKKKRVNINMKGNKKGENEKGRGPEEIHWFLVKTIQEAKKLQNNIEFN